MSANPGRQTGKWTGTHLAHVGVTFNDSWRVLLPLCGGFLPAEGPVNCRAGHREQLGQVADRVGAGVVHPAQFLLLPVGRLGLLAAQLAAGACDCHALTGAEPDEVCLELGEGGEDVEEHLSHGIDGIIDTRSQREPDAAQDESIGNEPRIRD